MLHSAIIAVVQAFQARAVEVEFIFNMKMSNHVFFFLQEAIMRYKLNLLLTKLIIMKKLLMGVTRKMALMEVLKTRKLKQKTAKLLLLLF